VQGYVFPVFPCHGAKEKKDILALEAAAAEKKKAGAYVGRVWQSAFGM